MPISMSKKQLSALFLCNLGPPIIGYGLVPLLPIYITRDLAYSSAIAGYLLALI